MRLTSSALAAAAFAVAAYSASAFQPVSLSVGHHASTFQPARFNVGLTTLASTTSTDESSPCAMPNDVIPESVTARALRAAVLTNANGDLVRLDEKMGPGTSVVIFLRHLG